MNLKLSLLFTIITFIFFISCSQPDMPQLVKNNSLVSDENSSSVIVNPADVTQNSTNYERTTNVDNSQSTTQSISSETHITPSTTPVTTPINTTAATTPSSSSTTDSTSTPASSSQFTPPSSTITTIDANIRVDTFMQAASCTPILCETSVGCKFNCSPNAIYNLLSKINVTDSIPTDLCTSSFFNPQQDNTLTAIQIPNLDQTYLYSLIHDVVYISFCSGSYVNREVTATIKSTN